MAEYRLVQTILHRHDEVAGVLAQRPDAYLPLFMNHEGSVIIEHWSIGFMLGIGVCAKAWGPMMIANFRLTLAPILAVSAHDRKLMLDVPDHKWLSARRRDHKPEQRDGMDAPYSAASRCYNVGVADSATSRGDVRHAEYHHRH